MARPKDRAGTQPQRTVRVRSRPLAEIDDAKLATALALMAKRLLEQRSAAQPEQDERSQTPGSSEEAA
ncbi:MAG TPA: hypothetical protein VHS03_08350 [Gaiellaceae bacterium]|jgi:hypothetical protein|nr:hypothetical protein [Gaiellaceae bacterium]